MVVNKFQSAVIHLIFNGSFLFMSQNAVCVSACSLRMGCGALDYKQQAQQMEFRTGGMSVSTHIIPDSTHLDMYEQVCVCVCGC